MRSLNEITQWHPISIQKWLQEVDEIDLILVLSHSSEAVKHLILENLSSRIRKLAIDSMDDYDKVPESIVKKAKKRALGLANELIELGELNEPGEEELYKITRNTILPKLLQTNNTANLIKTMTILGEYAKERGLLALEEALIKIKDPFLRDALQLIIDGTEADVAEEILRNRVEAITYHRELLYNLIIEGILGIQTGNSSWILRMRLKSYLPPEMGGENGLY